MSTLHSGVHVIVNDGAIYKNNLMAQYLNPRNLVAWNNETLLFLVIFCQSLQMSMLKG